jgi:hypothetical protein
VFARQVPLALTGPLGGVVAAAQYPTGGEGRITTV